VLGRPEDKKAVEDAVEALQDAGYELQNDYHWTLQDEEGSFVDPGSLTPELRAAWEIVSDQDISEGDPEDPFSTAKYQTWQQPGGENYRELVITLPVKKVAHDWGVIGPIMEKYDIPGDIAPGESEREMIGRMLREYGTRMNDSELRLLTAEQVRATQRQGDGGAVFRQGHYSDVADNVLLHVRLNERTDAEGKGVLFIEEIQSDFGQKTRAEKGKIAEAVDNDFQGIVDRMKNAGVLTVECD
jgi:hypothetical protein